jgi:hypothetical protein
LDEGRCGVIDSLKVSSLIMLSNKRKFTELVFSLTAAVIFYMILPLDVCVALLIE